MEVSAFMTEQLRPKSPSNVCDKAQRQEMETTARDEETEAQRSEFSNAERVQSQARRTTTKV